MITSHGDEGKAQMFQRRIGETRLRRRVLIHNRAKESRSVECRPENAELVIQPNSCQFRAKVQIGSNSFYSSFATNVVKDERQCAYAHPANRQHRLPAGKSTA